MTDQWWPRPRCSAGPSPRPRPWRGSPAGRCRTRSAARPVAGPARRHPPGPRRGGDRAGGWSTWLAGIRAAHRHLPDRARTVAPPPPRDTRPAIGPRSWPAADSRWGHDPLPRRPPSTSPRAGAARTAPVDRRTDRWRRRGREHRPRRTGGPPLDWGRPRSVAQAAGPGRDRARDRSTRAALGVTPAAVSIRDQRTRWGSASRQSRLAFSWRLISPRPRRSRRSSSTSSRTCASSATARSFWSVVASRRPDHKVWRRWLHHHRRSWTRPSTSRGGGGGGGGRGEGGRPT